MLAGLCWQVPKRVYACSFVHMNVEADSTAPGLVIVIVIVILLNITTVDYLGAKYLSAEKYKGNFEDADCETEAKDKFGGAHFEKAKALVLCTPLGI